jgi:hypothetical protein
MTEHTHKIKVNKANPRGIRVDYTPEEIAALDARDVHHKAIIVPANRLKAVRQIRNVLLTESDFTQVNDRPDNKEKADWATYRQKLRDIPVTDGNGNPTNIEALHKSWQKAHREPDFPKIGDVPFDDGMWPTQPVKE